MCLGRNLGASKTEPDMRRCEKEIQTQLASDVFYHEYETGSAIVLLWVASLVTFVRLAQNDFLLYWRNNLYCIVRAGDRLCGLVVTVPGCLPRRPGFRSQRYQIFWVAVGLERGPLSLVRINEKLLEREVTAPV
jgi:hypothetical protein